LVVVVAEEEDLQVLLLLLQEPSPLQHFLSEQDLVQALLSLEPAACCPKAKLVMPRMAAATNNFFIVFSFMEFVYMQR
jgi:hypothetical protein